MKRIIVLATLLTVGALSMVVTASQQPAAAAQAAPQVVAVEKLRDNLFMLTGGGGNTEVFVHENTAANMQEMRASTQTAPNGQPPNIFKANNGRGMPKKTFKDRMTIGTGADRIDLYYFCGGHTNGDAWGVFAALRAMHAGDI